MIRRRIAWALFFWQSAMTFAAPCAQMSWSEFEQMRAEWKGRDLVAAASWCSSCKEKLIGLSDAKDGLILVAFDDVDAVEKTMAKLGVKAKCIAGDEIVKKLEISSLPWSMKM